MPLHSVTKRSGAKQAPESARVSRRVPTALPTARAPSRALTSACACGGGCPRCRGQAPVQTKLKVNTPGDVYEREADRVAVAVIGGATLRPSLAAAGHMAQRLADHESPSEEDAEVGEAEDDSAMVQRLTAAGAPNEDGSGASAAMSLPTSGGAGLPAPVGEMLGARMGADFSGVRVHADRHAAQLASDLSARAFASGAHVYFAVGEYRPETREGLRVLAHELAHVVQQGAAPRTADSPLSAVASTPPVQRLSALTGTSRSNLVATNVYPWKGRPPVGNDYRVQTDTGNDVKAWVAYSGVPADHQYWCHGFSLGSYGSWSYSVYSGKHMRQVVADEYNAIANTSAGDLAAWTVMPSGDVFGHSAKFTQPVVSGGALDEGRSKLDSKNGMNALANYSLTQLVSVYGPGYEVFRHR